MFKRVLISVLAALQMTSYAAAYSLEDGQFYYRYKAGFAAEATDPGQQTKDITAYYIGGVGKAFNEKLPMKPQWEDDSWKITKGTLPKGISFNSGSLNFEGTPETVVSNATIELNGFDSNGKSVASAIVYFTTYQLPDQVVDVDIYNHTGKFGSYALKLPAGVVIDGDPKLLSPVPPGVSFNARYFDGVPTKAGNYPVLAFGYDYLGKAVVAFTGHYLVEDTPTFAKIDDDVAPLREIEYYGCGQASECRVWDQMPAPKVNQAIKDAGKVRYLVEVKSGEQLPGDLNFYDGPYNLKMSGRTYDAFDQATIRYKAIDTDGTVGYSNWFKIGSLGLTAVCQPNAKANEKSVLLRGNVGLDFNGSGYKIPTGYDTSSKTFTITDGVLPGGLFLDAQGVIVGKPQTRGDTKGITIRIDYPGVQGADPTFCGPYDFQILPDKTSLDVLNLKQHYRVGESIDVELKPLGAVINPWTVKLTDGAVLPSGLHYDETTHRLTGTVNQAGNFTATFTFKNGDMVEYPRPISFVGHGALDIHDVAEAFPIKKFDTATPLVSFQYDTSTPITPGSETFSLIGGPLPDGLTFNPYDLTISGGTRLPENRYGPFRIKLTDFTGQFDETNDFYIEVTPRAGLTENATVDPLVFYQNLKDDGQLAFSVTQPTLAQGSLPLSYALSPSTLPNGLVFNETSGEISGKPTTTGETDNYRLTVSEVGPDNLSKISKPFAIVVEAAPPINDQSLPSLEGNKDGPLITSASPTPFLAKFADKLVGGTASVVFDGVDPAIDWLSFDSQYGTVSGTPSEEYQGSITVNYHDGANRPGKLKLPITIYPYPQLKATGANFELPRLSQAADFNIGVEPANSGFYKGATYQLAPGSAKLPAGLSLSDGHIVGTTSVAAGTNTNIVIRAISNANGIVVDYPVVLKIVGELPMKLDIVPDENLLLRIDEKTGVLSGPRGWFTNPKPSGSYTGLIKWSLQDQPSWMTIGQDGQIYGNPSGLGQWTVKVVATDAENHRAIDTVIVKVTLSGDPLVTELSGAAAVGDTIMVRAGETFRTTQKRVVNAVKPWQLIDQSRPDSLSLDQSTGAYTGYIEQSGIKKWSMAVEDADGRKSINPVTYTATVIAPLSMPMALSHQNGKQYDPTKPISIQFQSAQNEMGKVAYGVTGDIPGSLYYKFYDNDDPSALATYIHQASDGQVTTVRQQPGKTAAEVEQALKPDHLIFDTLALTLKGIPSKSGNFAISLIGSDDHQETGYSINPNDTTRVSNNVAQSAPVTITVAPADDLLISNSATSEALSQYTSAPALTTSVVNDAYGRGMTWRTVTGTLPPGLRQLNAGANLVYGGYANTQGSWGNISWEGTDAAGRKITSDPISFTVGPRQTLALTANPKSPRPMIVFSQDANLTVTAVNVANGLPIDKNDWVVSGVGKLPPGVSYTVADGTVRFFGKSDIIGIYSGITVSAKDSLNASASIALTFNVIANPDPIELNVYNIRTKPGFPIIMEPPFAQNSLSTGNTYGDIRFYSNDLPTTPGVTLNEKTGYLSGALSQPGTLNFDLFVTDDTDRVTSKPVKAEVIPNLRLIVPTVVDVEQGVAANENIATDYTLGKVTYAKGAGNWPAGIDVDADTGQITGYPLGAKGDYTGLTIIGTDTFGSFADVRASNVFAIHINPTTAAPVISDVSGNKLIFGKVGSFAEFVPNVVDNKAFQPWLYQGTVYSLNKALPDGLHFDSATGRIYGTANEPAIISDLTIRVTSELGDTDVTAPFWFGVAPKDPITANATNLETYKVRALSTIKTNVPVFDNVFGPVTYSLTSGIAGIGFDPATGVMSGTLSSSNSGTYPVGIIARDQFNRTGTLSYYVKVNPALTASLAAVVAAPGAVANIPTPTVTGGFGTLSYQYTGLPSGISADATGKLSGTFPNTPGSWTVNLVVTDSDDGAKASTSFTITLSANAHKYFQLVVIGSSTHPPVTEITPGDAPGVDFRKDIVKSSIPFLFDGDPSGQGASLYNSAAAVVNIEFSVPHAINWVSIDTPDSANRGRQTTMIVRWSDDGINYRDDWSQNYNTTYLWVVPFTRP